MTTMSSTHSLARLRNTALPVIVLLTTLACTSANAALLLDTGVGSASGFRSSDVSNGVAFKVVVSTATMVTGFSTNFFMPNGGNVKFFIWDSTGSNNLYLGASQAVGASATASFFQSNPLSLALAVGSTYYFGFIGNSPFTINYTFFIDTNQNGLLMNGSNLNYSTFANPTLHLNDFGGAQGDLRIYGTQGAAINSVPEPASIAMLGIGLAAIATFRRRA